MKSCRTQLEEIAAPQRLLTAWRRYRAGKRRRPGVAWFEIEAEKRLLELSEQLLDGRYRHRPCRVLAIRDPKPRLIAVASVGDRVVHRAIYDALGSFFERSYIADTYACLPGRGSHRAVLRFLQLLRRYNFVLHLDIRSYFPSVDHGILLGLLAARLRDGPGGARLVETILASGRELYSREEVAGFYGLDRRRLRERPQGLPIGNLTSQWWGNLYLNGVDHWIARDLKVPGYLRYMDDLVLFASSAADLRAWRDGIGAWLQTERRLEDSRCRRLRSVLRRRRSAILDFAFTVGESRSAGRPFAVFDSGFRRLQWRAAGRSGRPWLRGA